MKYRIPQYLFTRVGLLLVGLLGAGIAGTANAQLAPPTNAEIDELIQTHGPNINFNGPNFPANPADTLDHPETRLVSYLVNNETNFDTFSKTEIHSLPTSSATILQDVQTLLRQSPAIVDDPRYRYVLQFPAELPGSYERAKAYVRVQPYPGDPAVAGDEICESDPNACVDLQFWIYYNWNGPGRSITTGCNLDLKIDPTGTARQHHSDWENIKVRVARDTGIGSSIINIALSQHDDYGEERFPSELLGTYETDHPLLYPGQFPPGILGRHPLIYSAYGSQANYFSDRDGDRFYHPPVNTDLIVCTLTTKVYDMARWSRAIMRAYEPGNYEIVSSAWPNVTTTSHDWLFFEGRWGDYAKVEYCIDIPLLGDVYCPDQAMEYGKLGLMRRGIFSVDDPQNANLGMLRFIEAIGQPQNASQVPNVVAGLTPAFDPNQTLYTLALDSHTSSLGVIAQAAETNVDNPGYPGPSKTKVEIQIDGGLFECFDGIVFPCTLDGNGMLLGRAHHLFNFSLGPHTIRIRVTAAAPSTVTKTYTINIIRDCDPDVFEEDDRLEAANDLLPGAGNYQIHNICGFRDDDWVKINVNAGLPSPPSRIIIGTSGFDGSSGTGPNRDTRIELYQLQTPPGDPTGQPVPVLVREADDSLTGGDWASLNLSCDGDSPTSPLDPGFYYAKIMQPRNFGRIDDFILTYIAPTECQFFHLVLSHTGAGADPQASPGCANCGAQNYLLNSVVTLTAAPAPGWQVSGWQNTNDDSSTANINTKKIGSNGLRAHVIYTLLPVPPVSDPGDGSVLSSIIALAGTGSVITFDQDLSGQTITLTQGALAIDKALTIDASNLPDGITISGDANEDGLANAGDTRVFNIGSAANVVLKGVTVTGGFANDGGAGGGINNTGTLTLNNSTVWGSLAAVGGGINNTGTLTLNNSTVWGNRAAVGGGIYNTGTLTLTNSTVSGNQADHAGGIANIYRSVNMIDSTVTMIHSTLSDNRAVSGGAGVGGGIITQGHLFVQNSIIAGNSGELFGDIFYDPNTGTLISEGANLIGNNATVEAYFPAGDPLVGTPATPLEPRLNPLGDYSGPTPTMPPFADSPAVDAALLITATSPTTDQRGVSRPIGTANDIGAVERSILDPDDTDRDGLNDALDNCIEVANANQRDTDGDGFGNICDPDFDNNLIVNAADLAFFKTKFFSSDPDADLNGDGIVNAADLAIFKTMFFRQPGPSGLVP